MTRMDIAEVSQEELKKREYFEPALFSHYEKVKAKKTFSGSVDGEVKFICGFCADEKYMACEVWVELLDKDMALSSVAYVRELLEYVRVRYELRHILASAVKADPTKRRFLEWLGFVDMSYESVNVYGQEIDYFVFKRG